MRLRDALVLTVGLQGVALVFNSAFAVLSSRWLGPEGRGALALVVSAAHIAGVFLGLGFDGAIPFFVAGVPSRIRGVLANVAPVLVGMAIALPALAAANHWLRLLPAVVGHEASASVLALSFQVFSVLSIATLAAGATGIFNAASVVGGGVALGALFGLRSLGAISVDGVLWCQAFGLVVGMGVLAPTLRRWIGEAGAKAERVALWRTQFRVALLGFLSKCFWLLLVRLDVFLVAMLTGSVAAAGVYSVGVLAAEVLGKTPTWAGMLVTTRVAEQGDAAATAAIGVLWLNVIVVVACFVPALAFPGATRWLFSSLLGPGFEAAYPCVIAMLPRVVFQAAGSVLAGALAGRGYTWFHPVASFAGLVTVIAFDFLLIPRYGILGAAAASGIGYAVLLGVLVFGFLRTLHVGWRVFGLGFAALIRPLRRT